MDFVSSCMVVNQTNEIKEGTLPATGGTAFGSACRRT
jgi:hypothetical protein